MNKQQLEIKTSIQIQKPANEVYEAIADPGKMANYFISESSGRMEAGKQLMWKFAEFDIVFPVRISKTEQDRFISFYWDVDENEHLVEIELQPLKDASTVVTISEKGRPNDEKGIEWLKGNTAGWANFLACLKAYAEYGINLRKGAFGFLSDKLPE